MILNILFVNFNEVKINNLLTHCLRHRARIFNLYAQYKFICIIFIFNLYAQNHMYFIFNNNILPNRLHKQTIVLAIVKRLKLSIVVQNI